MREYLRILPAQKRDASIELLRIYACFLVVLAHIQLGYHNGQAITSPVILSIKCLISDDVPIFFTILGFFFFSRVQEQDRFQQIPGVFLLKLKSFLVRIYIPTIIVTLMCCFAFDFIYQQKTFGQLFTDVNWHGDLLTRYIFLQKPEDMVGQFWYIVSYFKLLLYFPLYALICADEKPYNILRRAYMLLIFLVMAGKDYYFYKQMEPVIDLSDYVLDTNALYILAGYEASLFFSKNRWKKRYQVLLSAGIFLTGYFVKRTLAVAVTNKLGLGMGDHFMVMECCLSYVTSCGALMLFYSLFHGMKSGLIHFLGEMTLYIFMLHGVMMRRFSQVGTEILARCNGGDTGIHAITYYLLYGGFLCLTSFLLGFVIRELYAVIRYGCSRIFPGKSKKPA